MKKLLVACACALGLFVGSDASAGSLPSEYQEVEYVESTGVQYLDTGVRARSGTKAEIEEPYTQINKDLYPDQYEAWKDSVKHSLMRFQEGVRLFLLK